MRDCLLIRTKDNKVFLTALTNREELLEFIKHFDVQIEEVKSNCPLVRNLETLCELMSNIELKQTEEKKYENTILEKIKNIRQKPKSNKVDEDQWSKLVSQINSLQKKEPVLEGNKGTEGAVERIDIVAEEIKKEITNKAWPQAMQEIKARKLKGNHIWPNTEYGENI